MGTARKHFSCGTSVRVVAASIIAASFAGAAHATTTFDGSLISPPGVYNGGGNDNSGFTINTENGVELGLAVQNRKVGQVHPDAGTSTYHVNTGFYQTPADFCSGICALWNFEFSVNLRADPSSTLTLSQVNGSFNILNVGNGQSITFGPDTFPDNAGWNGAKNTVNGTTAQTDWGAQNSENLAFGFVHDNNANFGFDPTKDDTYIVSFLLKDNAGNTLDSISETIVAGAGAPTPLPAALPLFASGLGVFGYFARRKKNKRGAVGALA